MRRATIEKSLGHPLQMLIYFGLEPFSIMGNVCGQIGIESRHRWEGAVSTTKATGTLMPGYVRMPRSGRVSI